MAIAAPAEPLSVYVGGRPAPSLRRFVDSYTGYRLEGFAPGVHVGLPSRTLTLVVALDVPLRMTGTADVPDRAVHTLLGGLHAGPVLIHHDGYQHGVQLGITPQGARALLGLPAAEVASTVVPLEAVLGRDAEELLERLSLTASWSNRFGVLDEILHRRVTVAQPIGPELRHAWHLLADSGGSIEVASVAHEVGWSRRHLSHRFHAEFGLSPKVMGRVMRFERAKGLMTAQRPVSLGRPTLADVAARSGYSDQAHMTRDWHEMTGFSPTGWMRAEEFPIVQDSDPSDDGE